MLYVNPLAEFLIYLYTSLLLVGCGDSFVVPTAAAPVTDCDMPCDGDDTEFCGGPDRLTIYTLTS